MVKNFRDAQVDGDASSYYILWQQNLDAKSDVQRD